jgi:hypothetical protein
MPTEVRPESGVDTWQAMGPAPWGGLHRGETQRGGLVTWLGTKGNHVS